MPQKREPIALQKRRQWGNRALSAYNRSRKGGEDDTVATMDEDIIDLVTDLLHLADSEGIDLNSLLCSARMHRDAERKREGGMKKQRYLTITVEIEGVVSTVDIPEHDPPLRLAIKDYDMDGHPNPASLPQDEGGRYLFTTYENAVEEDDDP